MGFTTGVATAFTGFQVKGLRVKMRFAVSGLGFARCSQGGTQ